MIKSTFELTEIFFDHNQRGKDIETLVTYVSTAIRRDWMLNLKRIIINGKVRDFEFKDLKGGVWEVRLAK